ncbi:MAG TPA: GNAT family N-acetyltransferase [Roseiflexaceae bacterium]|nr:GNAT family N-acetyltransferase [Roseiflexaceae bacterium]
MWTVERGTLWVMDAGDAPPLVRPRVAAQFHELSDADRAELAAAMSLPTTEPIQRRLQSGRRCFALNVGGRVSSYGWATRGAERVGELEREFHLQDDEAYIWDCATLPGWRRQGLYSALLSHIAHRLRQEGVARVWIGASRQNRASVRGFANAGFRPVLDLTYLRVLRLTLMWVRMHPTATRAHAAAAYRLLLNARERRLGPLVLGFLR